MARLTTEEKANRYDALQAAIEINIKTYKSRIKETEERYTNRADTIAAYNKGLHDAYVDMAADLAALTN